MNETKRKPGRPKSDKTVRAELAELKRLLEVTGIAEQIRFELYKEWNANPDLNTWQAVHNKLALLQTAEQVLERMIGHADE